MLCPVVGCCDCVSLLIKVVLYLYNDVSMLIIIRINPFNLLLLLLLLSFGSTHGIEYNIHVSIYRHYRHTYIYTYVIIVYILDY